MGVWDYYFACVKHHLFTSMVSMIGIYDEERAGLGLMCGRVGE